ncbi:MAG: secretin [Gammaproteobacteria bacterium]|nr:secretin [Gammaproteobacteria bacterium]
MLTLLLCLLICTNSYAAIIFPKLPIKNKQIFATQNSTDTIFIQLHYTQAQDAYKEISNKNSKLLSKTGKIILDKRTNSIWISDNPENIQAIKDLMNKIDKPSRQVLISARIINADDQSIKQLGIQFNTTKAANTNNDQNNSNSDTPTATIGVGKFNLPIAKLGGGVLLDMELKTLEKEGHAKIISSPKLLTLDRTTAHIESGEDIPYQERTSQGNTNTAFKKAVLGLKVTPFITDNKKIMLKIIMNQDQVSALTVHGVPAVKTREISTQVLLKNNQTIILGGIYEKNNLNTKTSIPIIRKIPILGTLLTDQENETNRKELLIFITPQIYKS